MQRLHGAAAVSAAAGGKRGEARDRGIGGRRDHSSLRRCCQDGWLRVKVENEFDPDAPAASRHGLGLQNVRGRLRALYENQARLDTQLTSGRFVVQVELPCAEHG